MTKRGFTFEYILGFQYHGSPHLNQMRNKGDDEADRKGDEKDRSVSIRFSRIEHQEEEPVEKEKSRCEGQKMLWIRRDFPLAKHDKRQKHHRKCEKECLEPMPL